MVYIIKESSDICFHHIVRLPILYHLYDFPHRLMTVPVWTETKALIIKLRFINLLQYINENTLRAIHKTMDKRKAYGIDKVTKEDYEKNLEENLANLVKRMKNGSYRPNPTRRVYIPK